MANHDVKTFSIEDNFLSPSTRVLDKISMSTVALFVSAYQEHTTLNHIPANLFKHIGVTFQYMMTKNFFRAVQWRDIFFALCRGVWGHATLENVFKLAHCIASHHETLNFSVSTLCSCTSYRSDSSTF